MTSQDYFQDDSNSAETESELLDSTSLEEKLNKSKEMRNLLFTMKDELQVQMDFLHNNINLIHEKINAPRENNVLDAPSSCHRALVKDLTNMHLYFKAERNAVNVVTKTLETFEEQQNSRVQELRNLEKNILNIKNNLATYEMSMSRPRGP